MRLMQTPKPSYVLSPTVEKLPDLTCFDTRYTTRLYQPAHAHQRASVYLVLHGALMEWCDHRSLRVTPGDLFFLPAGQLHANHFFAPETAVFSAWMGRRWLQRLEEYGLALDAPAYFPGGPLSGLALRLRREARESDAASALVMEGVTLELLGEIARCRDPVAGRRPPRWLAQTEAMLRERFAENLTLEEIARGAGVHPVHLASAFRDRYGCTVGDFVRRLRIEHACREIARSDTPLIEIALDAGFANQSHFTRVFKQMIGLTPARYRREFSSL
jgi:AraC family transcriptional regulator